MIDGNYLRSMDVDVSVGMMALVIVIVLSCIQDQMMMTMRMDGTEAFVAHVASTAGV